MFSQILYHFSNESVLTVSQQQVEGDTENSECLEMQDVKEGHVEAGEIVFLSIFFMILGNLIYFKTAQLTINFLFMNIAGRFKFRKKLGWGN